jgi:hypothetical protein
MRHRSAPSRAGHARVHKLCSILGEGFAACSCRRQPTQKRREGGLRGIDCESSFMLIHGATNETLLARDWKRMCLAAS